MVPSAASETRRPLLPKSRYRMGDPFLDLKRSSAIPDVALRRLVYTAGSKLPPKKPLRLVEASHRNPHSVFDPFRKVCGQSGTTGARSGVVIGLFSDLAITSTYNRSSRYRNRNSSGESSVKRLRNGDVKRPLRDHMISEHE